MEYTDLCKQVELQAMAEDIAAIGYQAPKFSWTMPCKYAALDVDTPTDTRAGDSHVIKSTIDFRAQIKAAWPVLLDQLQQLEIPMTAITTFDGIGFVANYDSAFTDHFLLQDVVKQLKDKGIIQ